jgi:hypothetical protein
MVVLTQTWKGKQIQKEEEGESLGSERKEKVKGGGENIEINMVFHLPSEFCLLEQEMVQLVLGAERAIFEKPE